MLNSLILSKRQRTELSTTIKNHGLAEEAFTITSLYKEISITHRESNYYFIFGHGPLPPASPSGIQKTLVPILFSYYLLFTPYALKLNNVKGQPSLFGADSWEDTAMHLNNWLALIKKEFELADSSSNHTKGEVTENSPPKVFVVHGHDDLSRLELCNLLRDEFKLAPVVLQDKPNNSVDTIISKFERLAKECSAAIVLFTPDDDAGENKRARQNVILELGYFLGKFQDEKDRKIIILKKGKIEIPSDISGVLYMEYNKSVTEIYYALKKQLQHWGYSF